MTITSRRAREIIGQRRKHLGALGEALVLKHLKIKGFRHITSNFLKRQGELDLVVEKDGKIHFMEVKTVSREKFKGVAHETGFHAPEENVSRWKMKKIARVAQIFLAENHFSTREWQFNVAVIYLDRKNRKAYIKFIKDITLEG